MAKHRGITATLAILSLLLGLAGGMARASEALNVYVGQGQMPFADDNPNDRGVYGDLMDELCKRLQRECRYHSVPWKRVQVAVAQDTNGIVLNLGRTVERERAFVWLLGVLPTSYVLASSRQRFDSLAESLEAGPVVVMGGTPRAQEAQALKQPWQAVVEVTDPEQAARMLHSGRAQSWYEIDLRVLYLWRRLGYPEGSVQLGRPVASNISFIAGSPVLRDADQLRGQMEQVFAAMRADGSWRRILAKHLGEEVALRLSAQ